MKDAEEMEFKFKRMEVEIRDKRREKVEDLLRIENEKLKTKVTKLKPKKEVIKSKREVQDEQSDDEGKIKNKK